MLKFTATAAVMLVLAYLAFGQLSLCSWAVLSFASLLTLFSAFYHHGTVLLVT